MTESDQDEILGLKGQRYTSDSLGSHLEVDNAMRQDLRLWTMRPDDVPWEQVQIEREERRYMNVQEKRRARGVKPRRKGTAEPWKALGMKKATYYRKKLHLAHETSESPVSPPVGTGDSRVSLSQPSRPALAASNVIPFPGPKKAKPSLVWTVPTPEQLAHMAELQRGYSCEAVESEMAMAA
jgi:hypothetical protein